MTRVLTVDPLDIDSSIYANLDRILSTPEILSYRSCIKMRLARTPVQYITGRQSFRYLNLRIEQGVFIPRLETELLAELVIGFVKFHKSPVVVDLGTGSGAVALSIAYEVPSSRVFAIDICSKALIVASENAVDLGVKNRVSFVQSNLLENLESTLVNSVDAIVSNPPYVMSAEIAKLAPEIKEFEPRIALDGGDDGLSIIRKIIPASYEFLKPGGLLTLEVGYGQASDVVKLIKATDRFDQIRTLKDYAGIERIVAAYRLAA